MWGVQTAIFGLTKEVLEASRFPRVQESENAPLVLTEPSAGNRAKKNSNHRMQRPAGLEEVRQILRSGDD